MKLNWIFGGWRVVEKNFYYGGGVDIFWKRRLEKEIRFFKVVFFGCIIGIFVLIKNIYFKVILRERIYLIL